MRTKMMVALVVLGLVGGIGCQQQRKPKAAAPAKGLQRIHFDFDRSEIKAEYRKTLEENAAWLKQNKGSNVTIEGHCDERGTEEYNIALGHRRAGSTKSYLVSLGVEGGRLSTKSMGEERPLESCHNESCWWKNRRAEFVR